MITHALQRKVDEVKALGWELKDDSFIHPHSNSFVEDLRFKSPRMTTFARFHEKTDIKAVEASIVAHEFIERVKEDLRYHHLAYLKDFFYANPSEAANTRRLSFNLK